MTDAPHRRRFRWSQTVACVIVGPVIAVIAAAFAYVFGGETTFFGEQLSLPEQVLGRLATVVIGPALLAGPLVYGWTRPDRVVLVLSAIAAAAVSVLAYWYFNYPY